MTNVKVLQVLGRSAGGVGRHVARIATALDGRSGLCVDVAAPGDLQIPIAKHIFDVDIPDDLGVGHVRAISRLRSLITMHDYDVVHSHGLRAGLDAAIASRATAARSLMTVHNVLHPAVAGRWRSAVFGWTEALSLALTDHVFAASEEIARHLLGRTRSARAKLEVLHLGVDGTPPPRTGLRRQLGISNDAPVIATVARLAPQKALDVMLRAVAQLPADVTLVIAGDGPLRPDLEELARSLRIAERVLFLGFREDALDVMASADVFCLSSLWEAVSLAAQEAVLVGIPVVTTDVGGMRELFEDRVSGRLVPRGDVRALAAALREVLASPDDAKRYVELARKTLSERFSTTAMLRRLEEAYVEGRRAD